MAHPSHTSQTPGPSIEKLRLKALRTACSPPHHIPDDQDSLRIILDRMFGRSFDPEPYLEELAIKFGKTDPADRAEATALIRELVHNYVTQCYASHLFRTSVMQIP